MRSETHKWSGRYCPFCLRALRQHIESGFEFCPADPECDYEVRPGGAHPPLTKPEKVKRVLENKQREHSLMLQRAGELQVEIARVTRELTEMGFPPPAGGLMTNGARLDYQAWPFLIDKAAWPARMRAKPGR